MKIQLVRPISKEVVKPVRVQIPHSLFNPEEDDSICLFCRSEDKAQMEKFKESNEVKGLALVLSIDDVKKYYREFKDRKLLLKEHTHFVCDARVVRQLYNLLGNVFSARNNYPIPVDLDKAAKIASSIQKIVQSTYMHLSGQNISVRLGTTAMAGKHVSANLLHGINFAVEKFNGQWGNVGSVHIKTASSAALPVYSKVEDEMLQFVSSQAGVKPTTKSGKSAASAVKATPKKAVAAPVVEAAKAESAIKKTPAAKATKPTTASKKRKAQDRDEIEEEEKEEAENVAIVKTPATGKKAKTATTTPAASAKKSKATPPGTAKRTSSRLKK